MLEGIEKNKTIHVGELGRKLIDAGRIFMGQPLLDKKFRYYENRKAFSIGPFVITPYLMDHSSVDAFGFLIEGEKKRIYYSGDFRAHGMKEKVFKWFLADPPKNVDHLLMEGTIISVYCACCWLKRVPIGYPKVLWLENSIDLKTVPNRFF